MAGEARVAEKAVAFGPGRSLVGVWTTTVGEAPAAGRPAVVMLNSGVIHHAGIWRLHVRLARALAAAGFASLRFDLSGLGDSARREAAATIDENVAKDVRDALAFVRDDRGFDEAVLLGLCSGARDCLEAAEREPGVVGLVAIDLVADLRTPQHHLVHLGRRLRSAEAWRSTLTGRNRMLPRLLGALRRGSSRPPPEAGEAGLGLRFAMRRPQLRRVVSALVARDVRQLFLFSGGLEDNYNHASQLREALPELAGHPNVASDYFPGADHTFSRVAEQQALIAGIVGWARAAFAPAKVAPERTSAAGG